MLNFRHVSIVLLVLGIIISLVSCTHEKQSSSIKNYSHDEFKALEDHEIWYNGNTLYVINVRDMAETGAFTVIKSRLDEWYDLGVRNIMLMPFYPIGEQDAFPPHGNIYAVKDHNSIDAAYGTKDELKNLVNSAHKKGIHVLFEMVLHHGSVDHVLIEEHPEYFRHDENGMLTRRIKPWKDIAEFDFENKEVKNYLSNATNNWVSEYNFDGVRFAHAKLIPETFWKELIPNLKSIKPDFFIFTESADSSLLETGFDAVYNTPLKASMDFCRLDDMAQPMLVDDVWFAYENFYKENSFNQTIHFLDDHFGSRSAINYSWPAVKAFAATIFTGAGIPQLYLAQEIGYKAKPSPAIRKIIDWNNSDPRYTSLYKELISLRNSSKVFRDGNMRRIETKSYDIFVFIRDNKESIAISASNYSGYKEVFTIPDSLKGYEWKKWDGKSFSSENSTKLDGDINIDPHGYSVWLSTKN